MMKTSKTLFISLILLLSIINYTFSETDSSKNNEINLEKLDQRYFHSHDGHDHDLSLAYIAFESDKITDPGNQFYGHWILERLETTDTQMNALIYSSGYEIWMDVEESYLQTSVKLGSSDKVYQDAPLEYHMEDGIIHMENRDFDIGYRDGKVILTMLGMDEAYRYTFIRE